MTWPIPTPEEQVQFLRNIQRLLAEGLFVASYKFALVHALADLAVLKGEDSGAPLEIDTKDIAAKFVELYWRQSRPFQVGGETTGLILQQNTGKQAAIISQIAESQQECGGSLFRLKQAASDRWSALVAEVDQVVRTMPLWKLQTVGDERLEFLYENLDRGSRITLKPGVAYCFRAFYELVRDLIEGAWVRFVQKLNANKLGNVTDLGTFLFGQERACLDAYRPILLDVQKGVCLYCQKPLSRTDAGGPLRSLVPLPRRPRTQLRPGPRPVQQRQVGLPGSREPPCRLDRAEPGASGRTASSACRGGAAVRPDGDGADRQVGVPADREGERAGVGDGEGLEASRS